MDVFTLVPGSLSLAELRYLYENENVRIELAEEGISAINASAAEVQRVLEESRVVYGINTGFGLLATQRVEADELELLQRSIVLSHATGVGNFLPDKSVRLIMLLKVNALSQGFSGIRLCVIEAILNMINTKTYPCIPEKGSVGASGDLAPLSHLALPLIGEGEVRINGELHQGGDIPTMKEILTLAPKEGLALLNGTQVSTALALEGLFRTENLLCTAVVVGSMTVDAARASRTPFDPRIHKVRRQRGQIAVADAFRHILGKSSEISASHSNCGRVQDPYSLRCQPQVLGACLNQIVHAADILECEANGVTDNPLVFHEDGDILSGGNFHAEPVGLVADSLACVIAEIGSISERRIAFLIDSSLSQLPPFLVEHSGVNSGFMLAQVTAAALASENKVFAHPATVDSLPTSANQEDHVSMATFAARRLRDMAENTAGVLAVELLAACQGLDFRNPLKSSPIVEKAKAILREEVSFYKSDRYFAPDIKIAIRLITSQQFLQLVPASLCPSTSNELLLSEKVEMKMETKRNDNSNDNQHNDVNQIGINNDKKDTDGKGNVLVI
eukprot:m.39110 g.39110  ORF g.39110 m.39110 type:complete len:561 (-) comp10265_c0_seq1:22-1704(-)